MIKKFGSDVSVNVIASVFASLIFLVAGFFWGRYQERQHYGKNLDEYNFYPFDVNRDNDVMKNKDRIEAFLKTLCRTDMQFGENILSKDEHAKAQRANGTSKTIAIEGLGG